VLIYSHTDSPRLKYVAQFLSHYFQRPAEVTSDKNAFLEAKGIKINYSANDFDANAIHIAPQGLLHQQGIEPIRPLCFQHANGYTAFFQSAGTLEFDLLAAIFFLLSRYEEYLPHQKDIYGRYAHQNSLAFKEGFLHLPLINIWLEHFRKEIHSTTGAILPMQVYTFLPTYDIDIAWSYTNKGLWRNFGGSARSLLKRQWKSIGERINVLRGRREDPYYSYDWMDAMHAQYNLKPLYFFHVGQKRNAYDKNINTSNKAFQQLIRKHANRYTIGLHPSWQSGDDHTLLLKEKKTIENIIGLSITASRQHYIRFNLPDTFRRLLAAGITDDYSMGYGSINGFRASVATSFFWYDLEKEEQTSLLLHPFCFMDANSFFEQRLSSEEAFDELMQYYREVKKVNGTLVSIWHNTFLGTDTLFKGWREMYLRFLEQVS